MWCRWTRGVAGRQASKARRNVGIFYTSAFNANNFFITIILLLALHVYTQPPPPSPKPLFAPPSRACDECIRILICQVLRHN